MSNGLSVLFPPIYCKKGRPADSLSFVPDELCFQFPRLTRLQRIPAILAEQVKLRLHERTEPGTVDRRLLLQFLDFQRHLA